MNKIQWGIIGCGDVTEKKSGPAFNKVPGSSLVAVMRRDEDKVKDYARRHRVPRWYTDAAQLINDPQVNAVYIATPPSSHEQYSIMAANAGKPVYVEKPMTVDTASAERMAAAAKANNSKLVVAHYRREQPLYKKIKELLQQGTIGKPRLARLIICKPALTPEELAVPKTAWRVNSAVAGGGFFHDLAPHQLDILYYFFGEPREVKGIAFNQAGIYEADDVVSASIRFENSLMFQGAWCFTADHNEEKDSCEIIGDKGSIRFSFFNQQPVIVQSGGEISELHFEPLEHVQQPMIAKVVDHFLDQGTNPCSAEEGIIVMRMMDMITQKA